MYSHPDRGNVTKQEVFLTRMFDSCGLNFSVPSVNLLPGIFSVGKYLKLRKAMSFLAKWNLVVLSCWKDQKLLTIKKSC